RERLGFAFEAGGESEVTHKPVHEKHGGPEAIGIFKAISHRVLDPRPHLSRGRITVAEGGWLGQGLAPAQTGVQEAWVPTAFPPGAGLQSFPGRGAAQRL